RSRARARAHRGAHRVPLARRSVASRVPRARRRRGQEALARAARRSQPRQPGDVGSARSERSDRRGAAAGADHPRPVPRRAHRRGARVGGARHRHLPQEPGARGGVARRADPADPHHAAPRARPPARRRRRRLARPRPRMSGQSSAAGTAPSVDLEQQLRIEKKKIAAVRELGKVLGATLDLDRLLVVLLEKVTDLLDAERATIYLVTDDGTHLESKIAQGGAIATIRLKTGEGIAGWVSRSGETVNIPDAYADARFNQSVDKSSGFRT